MMIYALVATVLLGAAIIGYVYEHNMRMDVSRDLKEECEHADNLAQENTMLKVTLANLDGVNAGNTANAIYRKYLEQFDRSEQISVMFMPEAQHYYAK